MTTLGFIARRVTKDIIQFGRGGSGRYSCMGHYIHELYAPAGDSGVEYLFSLGQLNRLGLPGSENNKYHLLLSHERRYEPHYMGFSENDMFYDYYVDGIGYFYDFDKQWYYVYQDTFRTKIPLWYIEKNLDENGDEDDFLREIKFKIYKKIFIDYPLEDEEFKVLIEDKGDEIYKEFLEEDYMHSSVYYKYRRLFDYFDKWVLIKPVDDHNADIVVKKKGDKHIETIDW